MKESEWRYGRVEAVLPEVDVVVLSPWPDASKHPDPKYELRLKQQNEGDEEELPDFQRKPRELEIPLSEYSEEGRLTRSLSEFIDIRKVDLQTVERFVPKTLQLNGTTKRKRKAPYRNGKKQKGALNEPEQVCFSHNVETISVFREQLF